VGDRVACTTPSSATAPDANRFAGIPSLLLFGVRLAPVSGKPLGYMPVDMIRVIRKAWAWIGLDPAEVVATNAFGNVIVRAVDGVFWRICPEELSCVVIAHSDLAYDQLLSDEAFIKDWEMPSLMALARERLGPLAPGRCYCLKTPGVFGGKYDAANLGTISRLEVVSFSGDMAQQIKDIPEGGRVQIKIVR
jgi:hypothetical protein